MSGNVDRAGLAHRGPGVIAATGGLPAAICRVHHRDRASHGNEHPAATLVGDVGINQGAGPALANGAARPW